GGDRDRDGGNIVEAALGDLVEAGVGCDRGGDPDGLDELAGFPHALAVAGEVLTQGNLPFALRPGEHERGVEGEEHGGTVTDRGAGAEVAAERRTVSDELRGEQREEVGEDGNLITELVLDLGEGESRPDLQGARAVRKSLEFLELIEGDRQGRAVEPDGDVHPPVGPAGKEDG